MKVGIKFLQSYANGCSVLGSGSPPANLGGFSNGKWTPVREQCHTTVHERANEALGQRFCSGRALKSTFMNGKKIHSTNDSVGGVDFFAVDERVYMNVHEQWHSDVDERSLECIWWTIAHKRIKTPPATLLVEWIFLLLMNESIWMFMNNGMVMLKNDH